MRRTPAVLSAAVVSLLAASAAAVVTAGAVTPVAPSGSSSVTVFLKAPDADGLDELASAHGLTHAQRVAALSRLLPTDATRAAVAAQLVRDGFTITSETSWSITATGAAARRAALFGTRPAAGRSPSAARFAAATGALPRIPAALGDSVAAAFPTTGGPAVFHHSSASPTSLTGADFRNADVPAHVAPSTGTGDSNVTIATLQLADFFGTPGFAASQKAQDLVGYATNVLHAKKNPVASHQYRAVPVDGGPNRRDDFPGGAGTEVALDQESILATAPTARQHAYFAPNTDAGFNDVFAQVLDDVLGNARSKLADPHIVALSTSWGACESLSSSASINALEPILKSLLAAGVTVFASTGDSGIYDCDSRASDVDYPASSPSVVGVGGTTLTSATRSANTGTNWTEEGWSCVSLTGCTDPFVGTGGGGGGASLRFAAPAYQRVGIDDSPFVGNAHRLVPDIAADANPQTGFDIWTRDEVTTGIGTHRATIGGTSLAAPISAAQLANTLADGHRVSGVGDIHGALYSAYLDTKALDPTDARKAFRDVTDGQNGAQADKGHDPMVKAKRGYDTVSGLGGVLWKAVRPYLVDRAHPIAAGELTEPSPNTAGYRKIKASWTITPSSVDTSRRQASVITISKLGVSTPLFRTSNFAKSGSTSLTVGAGSSYMLTVVASDIAGRQSVSRSILQVPLDDTAFRFSSGWHRSANASDFGGSHAGTAVTGATATATATGRKFSLVVPTAPNAGRLGVFEGKKLITRVDLFSAKSGHRVVHLFSRAARASHTFSVKALGTKSARSHGARVLVDALRVVF
jgi:hypothetical protein